MHGLSEKYTYPSAQMSTVGISALEQNHLEPPTGLSLDLFFHVILSGILVNTFSTLPPLSITSQRWRPHCLFMLSVDA